MVQTKMIGLRIYYIVSDMNLKSFQTKLKSKEKGSIGYNVPQIYLVLRFNI